MQPRQAIFDKKGRSARRAILICLILALCKAVYLAASLGMTGTLLEALFVAVAAMQIANQIFLVILSRRAPAPVTPSAKFLFPTVSVIIPAYNEAKVIRQTVESVLGSDHKHINEVVVVNDGSTDGTGAVLAKAFPDNARLIVLSQENAGKATALNTGVARTTGDVVVTIDADTIMLPNTITALVDKFSDGVGAVAGNMRVGNCHLRRNNLIEAQRLEYLVANNIERWALDRINCMSVVPGACGAYRRDALKALNGFEDDTLAEDCDLTMRMLMAGYRILYQTQAIVYTEVPDSFAKLIKQRIRWHFGKSQSFWKNRIVLFNPRYGAFGMVIAPMLVLSQILFPLLLAGSLLWLPYLVISFVPASNHLPFSITKIQPGAVSVTCSVIAVSAVLNFFFRFVANHREGFGFPKLSFSAFIGGAMLNAAVVSAGIWSLYSIFAGKQQAWNKLPRSGTVSVDVPPKDEGAISDPTQLTTRP